MKKDSKVSFYAMLNCLAIVLLILLARICFSINPSSYIDNTSVFLGMILTVICMFITRDARKTSNNYLFILSLWSLVYCVLRIVTLYYTDFSTVLERCNADSYDINWCLVYTIVCVLTLWIALHKKERSQYVGRNMLADPRNNVNSRKVLVLFWIALIIEIIVDNQIPILCGIASIIKNFILNIVYVFYMMIVYMYLYRNQIEKKYKYIFILSVLAFVIYRTLQGSRAGIFGVLKMFLYISLALEIYNIKRKYILIGTVLLPIMIFFFSYATYMRKTYASKVSLETKMKVATTILKQENNLVNTDVLYAEIYERIGFFDFTCEMVTNKRNLSQVINPLNEIRSIIDNALTPGFDLFDQARMSHLVSKYYEYKRNIPKTKFMQLNYQSDELTLFGESYLLLPLPINIFFVFLVGLVFRILWIQRGNMSVLKRLIRRAIAIYLFEELLSSYGIDWFILDTICMYITYKIFMNYTIDKKVNYVL